MNSRFSPDPQGVTLYALSTCIWCRKTRRLLDSLGVKYNLIEMDRLTPAEQRDAEDEVMRWNKACSYPIVVVRAERAILGYKEDEIRKLLA